MKIFTFIKNKTPDYLKNKWAISITVLFFWVVFFEDINLFSLVRTKSKINSLEQEWTFKENRIQQAEEKKALILDNPEKYARETFWMKKENEELFIISSESQ